MEPFQQTDSLHRNVNPWLVAIAVMVGTFMEVLDTTVVNVSIPHIAGNLSSTNDEATWVLTSYLVANAIVLPMTGWLANQFGRKRLLLFSVVGFTISSFLCGLAPSLALLVIFRIVQGLSGGGLQPLSQAILLEVFPPAQRGKAMAFWGLGIVVAPMLGPVLGGWLTDSYSWRWIFYLNVPIGVLAVMMTQAFVFDPPYIGRKAGKIDYYGIALLVLGIGAVQIVLDKGQQEDWFASNFIRGFAVLGILGIAGLIIRELMAEHPIVDLRVFKNRTYATGVFLMTVMGFVLLGSTVLLPLFMQTLLGYSAMQAGLGILPRGLASFAGMALVGQLTGRIDARKLLAAGLILASGSLYFLSGLNLNSGYWDFFWPLLLQGSALGLLFIPLTTITNSTVPKEQMGNATSIFNLTRNLGSSIGIASVTTILARNTQMHINQLGEHVNPYNMAATSTFSTIRSALIAQGSDFTTATEQARQVVWGIVQRQAAMMSYQDSLFFLGALFIVMLPLVLLMRRPKHERGPVMTH